MRTPLVAGNWKMNLTLCEAEALSKALIEPLQQIRTIDIAVCPAFPFIPAVVQRLVGTNIQTGAQNISWEDKGAFTGEVSSQMIDSLVRFVIIGHSERRQKLGETDGMINWKVLAALKADLTPILCVGEDGKTRDTGDTEKFVAEQVMLGLKTVEEDKLDDFVIAYEPLWAIGTGKSATAGLAEEGCELIRGTLRKLYSDRAAEKVRILYGGSVNAGNAASLTKGANVDGFLVGNASLQVEEFVGICQAVADKK